MIYLVLIFYILLFAWWIKSSSSFAFEGLTRQFIFFIFISKLVAGISYGLIHTYYFNGGDTFLFFQESTLIGNSIFSNPQYYLYSLLGWSVEQPTIPVFIYPEPSIFWKDLGSYVLVHWHGLLHPLTLGNYYLHIFFIAIVSLFASLNFYKLFKGILDLPQPVLLICCFFLPSLTFWTSGLHKDAYVYYALSLLFLGMYQLGQNLNNSTGYFKVITALLLVGLFRHYLLVLIMPATIAYIISLKQQKQLLLTYSAVYVVFLGFFMVVSNYLLDLQIFQVLADKQAAFMAETGGSSIKDISSLNPSFLGIIGAIPIAIVNVMARPFLWECADFLQLLASIEILCFLLLMAFSFVVKRKQINAPNLLLPYLVAFAVSNLLLIGLLVVNSGTIVRYRSIALGLLTLLITRIVDFRKIGFKQQGQSKSPISNLSNTKKPHSKSAN